MPSSRILYKAFKRCMINSKVLGSAFSMVGFTVIRFLYELDSDALFGIQHKRQKQVDGDLL